MGPSEGKSLKIDSVQLIHNRLNAIKQILKIDLNSKKPVLASLESSLGGYPSDKDLCLG